MIEKLPHSRVRSIPSSKLRLVMRNVNSAKSLGTPQITQWGNEKLPFKLISANTKRRAFWKPFTRPTRTFNRFFTRKYKRLWLRTVVDLCLRTAESVSSSTNGATNFLRKLTLRFLRVLFLIRPSRPRAWSNVVCHGYRYWLNVTIRFYARYRSRAWMK